MVTGWTLFIVLIVAYGNALVAMVGVRTRVREGMRLWANDQGYYQPRHFGYPGFYRGLFINTAFAGTSFALAAVCLPGDSTFCGREAILGGAAINFGWGFAVACVIPSSFDEVITILDGMFWRVFVAGILSLGLYVCSGLAIGQYVTHLRAVAQ
jgi:hypothetical protein